MAALQVSSFLLLLLLLLLIFQLNPHSSSAVSVSIHDLLRSNGLPAGLLPKQVSNYSLSETGLLEVYLEGPCLTKFDTMALYDSVVRANLTHGGLTGVEGFSQEELFVWLPVKGVVVDDPSSGLIFIDIGLAHKQLSLSLFEDPPDCCTKLGVLKRTDDRETSSFATS
ncbi:unnamed protein product [Cuscuta campestris]|uniref:Uncharacterized protein n=1 Tax=Cuscuta campestris TaxID=132261 RepID=A0A484JZS6_9ASTE|nr:unnamed protein product [Cuscuta campestris]